MKVLEKFFAPSPIIQLHEHSKKVHDCVELLRPLANALLDGDYEEIEKLHKQVSKAEHKADQIKTELRDCMTKTYFLSVGRMELSRFLGYQDDVADAAEDFAVLLLLRKTRFPEELKDEFIKLVDQVITVCEHLLAVAEKLSVLAKAAFTGGKTAEVLEAIEKIGQEEWQADLIEMDFARHFYGMEDKLDPITIFFLDKYCKTLSRVSNNAEKAAKYLRLIIRKK
ncbi:MAG: TIGR00153 family protein [Sedimentisphaerales bacterium]|nr:TIGR00153 family protein [Sedimentisphaerales bacterium]